MKLFFFIVGFLFAFLLVSCEKKDKLNSFFNNLKNELPKEDLLRIEKSSPDSLITIFNEYRQQYIKAYEEEIKNNININNWIDEQLDTIGNLIGYHFLIYSFHADLNNTHYSVSEIKYFHKKYQKNKLKNEEQSYLETEKKLLKYIAEIDGNMNLGDTFELVFPFERKNDNLIVRHGVYPYSSEIFSFEDSLFIRGTLLRKKSDSLNLQYLMRITDISETDIAVFGDSIVVGDAMNFYLKDYGREVKRVQQ